MSVVILKNKEPLISVWQCGEFGVEINICASHQIQWKQIVFVSESPAFGKLQNIMLKHTVENH